MASLLERLQETRQDYQSRETEEITVKVSSVRRTKKENVVMMITDQGTFFHFLNAGTIDKPVGFKGTAVITLEESKDKKYVNVAHVDYDLSGISGANAVNLTRNAVVLS